MRTDRGYGNFKVYSPDNILMFHTNKRRLNFYLKNDLIDQISEREYRLKFKPNGNGYSDLNRNPLLLIERQNRCVCSGETNLEVLTRHHIVPSVFRRHFPEERKSNNFLFVVQLTRDLHNQYTIEEHKFYDVIAKEFQVPFIKDTTDKFKERYTGVRYARTLLKHGHKIPYEKFLILKSKFEELTGMIATDFDSLQSLLDAYIQQEGEFRKVEYNFGKLVVSKITDFDAFEMKWLTHFIDTMKPKFLPEDLKNHIQLYNEK